MPGSTRFFIGRFNLKISADSQLNLRFPSFLGKNSVFSGFKKNLPAGFFKKI